MPSEDLPGMAEIKEYLDAEGKTLEDINQKFIQGWTTAKIMVAGIQEAAKNHPDGDINWRGNSFRSRVFKDLDLGGLGAPVSFSADNHTGTEQTRLGIVKDGKWEAD